MSTLLVRGRKSQDYHFSTCSPKRLECEDCVISGLAVTPSMIEKLTQQGVAVSLPNSDNFLMDNDKSQTIPIELQRDTDRNTVWELSQSSKQRLLNAKRKDKERYE